LLTTIRQAIYLLGREQRKRWAILLGLALFTSVLEIVAAAFVYVLLGLVANPSGAVKLPLIGNARALAGDLPERTFLLILIGVMIAFFFIRAAAAMGAEYVMQRMTANTAANLSARLARGYLSLPYAFHLRHSSAELIRNAHQVPLEVVNNVFLPLIRLMAETILTLGMLALLIAVSPIGTALAVAVVGGSTVILMLLIQPRIKRFGATAHAMHRDTLSSIQQAFQGVRDVKLLGRERFFSEAYGRRRRKLARMLYTNQTIAQSPRYVIETSLILFILAFFAVTIARGGTQSALATLGLFGYAGLRLQPSLQRIAAAFNSLKFATAPTADIHRDLRLIEQNVAATDTGSPFPFEREIRLEEVSFAYEGTRSDALSEVTLTIERGEQIGICGPTGGGKTTLVDLIAGLLSPAKGRVLVDDVDIATNLRGWQRNLGVVPQMVFLIDDTLRRNIALGIPDDKIDEAAVWEAVQLAQLEAFVKDLPEGLETVVGERGVRLSGGERQRIAIARALYYRPQVLIFDEGTSALDNATEQELMRALRSLRGEHTILLVAHRLSTVRDADRVVFVENGRIAGIDTFDGLCAWNESFRAMAGVA
jgi:ABC-type multidrug transport system fused ATPase/permease subunit